MHLLAESSVPRFSVEPQHFDFGVQLYDRTLDRELMVSNTGRVPVTYHVDLSKLTRAGTVEVLPPTGTVMPASRESLKIKARAGVPDVLEEVVFL